MTTFKCPSCSAPVYFENTTCQYCLSDIGYNPYLQHFQIPTEDNGLEFCSNYKWGVCNWLVTQNEYSDYCLSCSLNRVVPSRSETENFDKWHKLEIAKRRLIYQLLKLQLPVKPKPIDEDGLTFDFISNNTNDKVYTGHANGVITILLDEADSVHREQLRKQLNEPYRTLLGHFRHEIGHYYWMFLFDASNRKAYRAVFGDERKDYAESLKQYYEKSESDAWRNDYITKYASAHSWEDWAETWAHYLHLMDTLETAHSLGIRFSQDEQCPNPYETQNFMDIYNASVALTCSVNSLNRSMGVPDIYPFVIPAKAVEKLTFIHDLLNDRTASTRLYADNEAIYFNQDMNMAQSA